MESYKPWGKSVAINLHECDPALVSNGEKLKSFILEVIALIDMVPHGECHVDRFGDGDLEGYSAMQFIKTSSITVHLDEQYNRAFIDIFSCKDFAVEKAVDFAKAYYKAQRADFSALDR